MTSRLIDNAGRTLEMRKFGLLTGFLFGLIFGLILPLMHRRPLPFWPWGVLALFWIPALLRPDLLTPVYRLWMKIGHSVGLVNSRFLMGLVYCFMIAPLGLVLQVLRRARIKKVLMQGDSFRVPAQQRSRNHFERIF